MATVTESHPNDIVGADQVAHLVSTFYQRVYADELLRPIFVDVAQLDLEAHLPKMNRFWGTILLGEQSYRSNAMQVHRKLHQQRPLTREHFERWLELWTSTVDELYTGPIASKAKNSAASIAQSMQWVLYGPPPLPPARNQKEEE